MGPLKFVGSDIDTRSEYLLPPRKIDDLAASRAQLFGRRRQLGTSPPLLTLPLAPLAPLAQRLGSD